MEMYPEKSKLVSIGTRIKWLRFVSILFILIGILLYVFEPFQQKGLYFQIPIVCSSDGLPCIQADIQGNKYLFELDSGGSIYFSIKEDILNKIKKTEEERKYHWQDIKGNEYASPMFYLDSIKILKMTISKVPAIKEDPFFHSEGSVLRPQELKKTHTNSSGRIGSKILRLHDYWLIDLPHHALYVFKNLEEMERNFSFSFEDFAEASLEQIEPHIVIAVETDFGLKKFVIDTGAYRSILRTPAELQNHDIITTNRFLIGGRDFGATQLYLFDINDRMEQFDGFLGRDFLEKHTVYLDFKNKKVYVRLSSNSLLNLWHVLNNHLKKITSLSSF